MLIQFKNFWRTFQGLIIFFQEHTKTIHGSENKAYVWWFKLPLNWFHLISRVYKFRTGITHLNEKNASFTWNSKCKPVIYYVSCYSQYLLLRTWMNKDLLNVKFKESRLSPRTFSQISRTFQVLCASWAHSSTFQELYSHFDKFKNFSRPVRTL